MRIKSYHHLYQPLFDVTINIIYPNHRSQWWVWSLKLLYYALNNSCFLVIRSRWEQVKASRSDRREEVVRCGLNAHLGPLRSSHAGKSAPPTLVRHVSRPPVLMFLSVLFFHRFLHFPRRLVPFCSTLFTRVAQFPFSLWWKSFYIPFNFVDHFTVLFYHLFPFCSTLIF